MFKKIIDSLVSTVIYGVAGLCFGLWAFLLIFISLFHTGVVFEKLIKMACRSVLFCAGIRVKAEGLEHIAPNTQYIIMMNHVNIFDIFVFYGHFPGKARAVEEESHFKWPVYGWLVRRIGIIPINRKSGLKALNALKKAGDLIKARKDFSFAVLPEGTRTRTGKLSAFKKGGFLLALESGLDILPVIQMGAYEIQRKGRRTIIPGKVRLIFEKPIPSRDFSKENVSELIENTRHVFLKYVE